MKTWFLLPSVFFLLLSCRGLVHAQTESIGASFPLTINGIECKSQRECKLLCDDPVNQAACSSLSAKVEKSINFKDPIFLQDANQTLGCTSSQTCKALCSLPINFEKCSNFAKKYKMSGGYEQGAKRFISVLESGANSDAVSSFSSEELEEIQAIKEKLATEGQTLEEYCDLQANQLACTSIARKYGLGGGVKLVGPGNCQTAESCRVYCDDPAHFSECKKFEVPGLNNCTSELACYNEAQKDPSLVSKLIQPNQIERTAQTQEQQSETLDTEAILKACSASLSAYEGKSSLELAKDFEKSGVCQVLPQSGIPGQQNNCEAYLLADQPFNQEVFQNICTISAITPGKDLPQVNSFVDASAFDSYGQWCTQLPAIGQAASDWQVVSQLCQNFVSTFKEARGYCDVPASARPSWLSDEVALSRYCLSAPVNLGDYAQSCAGASSDCQSGGYDWYCRQPGKQCVPLYQGTPIGQAVSTFSDAGLIKDGSTITVVLDETTSDFASDVLTQTANQTGNDSPKIEVVSEVPESISQNAVFAAGVGSKQGTAQIATQPFFFKPVGLVSPPAKLQPTHIPGLQDTLKTSFEQPWYAIDAGIKNSPQPTASVTGPKPLNQESPKGWQIIKQNEQAFKQIIPASSQDKNKSLLRPETGTDVRPLDPKVLKQVIERPISEPAKVSPVYTIRSLSPTPTPVTQIKNSTTTGTTAGEPTTYQPAPTVYIPPPTQPPSTSTNTTTTTGTTSTGGTSSSGGSGSTGTILIEPTKPPTTETGDIEGVHTEKSFWQTLFMTLAELFNS